MIVEQAEAITLYLARFQPTRYRAVVVPLAILACVFPLSWLVASLLLISAPLIPVFMALIGWRAKAASERQLGEIGSMNAFLLDRLRGLATIRALGAVDATAMRVRAEAESVRVRTMAVLRIAFLSSAALELFAALGVAMVAVYVGFHFLGQLDVGAWGHKLSLAEGLFVLLLAPAFFEPLRDLSAAWHDRAAGEAAIETLDRLNENGVPLPGADGTNGENLEPAVASRAVAVKVESLCYRHRERIDDVFDGLDLSVAAGEHVALLAPSGSGKSTLLAVIAGLAAPTAGRIVIGESVLNDVNANTLRRRMAWIGQTPHIFAGSLATNVSLHRPDVSSDRTVAALAAMQLGDVLKRGASAIGEGGIGLSGGEALRLALTRIAVAPEAGLILADEPTAHLDSDTARDIVEALKSLAQRRTLIVATHDPAVAAQMDRVVSISKEANEAAA